MTNCHSLGVHCFMIAFHGMGTHFKNLKCTLYTAKNARVVTRLCTGRVRMYATWCTAAAAFWEQVQHRSFNWILCMGHSVHYVVGQFWTSDILAVCQAVFTGRSIHVVHGLCITIDILAVLNEWYSSCLSSSICRPFCTCWILAVYQACDLHPPFNCPIGRSFSRWSDCVLNDGEEEAVS